MPRLLDDISFRNPARARGGFDVLTRGLPDSIEERIQHVLMGAPDPDIALACLLTLRERNEATFLKLLDDSLASLVAVFSHSRFLSDEVLQRPEWIALLDFERGRTRQESIEHLESFLKQRGVPANRCPEPLLFAEYRRREILRILLRDVMGHGALADVTEELSNLADAILDVAYRRIRAALEVRYGTTAAGFSVVALGKLGGNELNYSSDIDLMFVYSDNGQTNGSQPVSNKEFFKRLSNQLTELLSTYTAAGLCYRIDLRLRPEGSLGEVCISVDGARQYYERRARDWELQMLIKARVAAGDPAPGRAVLDAVEDRIYSTTLDFSAVESMSATRDRIDEKLMGRRPSASLDVKLARGGIRDIEFLVQCLQRLHGGRFPWLRHGSTLLALSRLHDKSLLSPGEYWHLASAYQFLRHLEHRLQLTDDRQTHSLPSDPYEIELLARRMPATALSEPRTRERLMQELNVHLERVIEIYERVIHAQKPIYYTMVNDGQSPNIVRALDESAPALAANLGGLKRGRKAFEQFLERAAETPSTVAALNADPSLAARVLDLFEHSPFFAEQMIREPGLLAEVRDPEPQELQSTVDPVQLRRFFRREMMRTMSSSVCDRASIFHTLGRTSDLAESVIAAAYRMAVNEVAGPLVQSADLMVIALGRLGQREFDLASDADLVFVIPDRAAKEHYLWTRVAERVVDILSAYTGEGVIFAVDTRLRPNGNAGPLVQTVKTCQDYFARSAEAWEGIAWMKARAVAGDVEAGEEFLHQIQDIDWRRYGQSGRSKADLRQMRSRLEKEQGSQNPLKAGRGGYYDIDFALMYLRLRGAGLFFRVLNTPERVDVIEKMGHLDREDAAFFQDAAVFYRAVDHALRVYHGHAQGSLPQAPATLKSLEELVHRWTPDRLNDDPLPEKLAAIQAGTRRLFDRLFA